MFSNDQINMMLKSWKVGKNKEQRYMKICTNPLMRGWNLGTKTHAMQHGYSWFNLTGEIIKDTETHGLSLTPELFREHRDYENINWDEIKAPEGAEVPDEHMNKIEEINKKKELVLEDKRLSGLIRPPLISTYEILDGKTIKHLQEQVRQKIKDGYQPLGGVSSAAFGISPVGGNKYIQAVVRYKES